MRFDQIDPSPHEIGGNETINLAKSVGITARTFEIVNTSLVSFHFEDLGASSPNVFDNPWLVNSILMHLDNKGLLSMLSSNSLSSP